MANLIALIDPDRERRHRFLREATPHLAFLDGLSTGGVEHEAFAAAWATGARTPLSVTRDDTAVAVLIGDAIPEPGHARLDADGLLAAWKGSGCAPAAFDGLHVALRYDAAAGLTVAADLLGLFPVFYAVSGGVVVVGSSPELFRLHPLFPPAVSTEGVVATLLAHATVGGRTLLRGVRRLGVAHALHRRGGSAYGETRQYEIPVSEDYAGLTFEDHLRILDDTYAEVLCRHVPRGSPIGLLLSGGRDSRLLAGYLDRAGADVHALTLGRAADYDAACAARVAARLRFSQRLIDTAEESYPQWASLQARWEHLATGFSNVHTWAAVEPMRSLPERCVSGYLREIREVPLGAAAFGALFVGAHSHGVPPDGLRTLLRPAHRDLVDGCLAELRRAWDREPGDPAARQWRFLLGHTWRAHPGGVLWRFSFGSWPVLPMLDRKLLALVAAMPSSTFADRRAQDELLRSRFPSLARLPLDRNDHDTRPLARSALDRVFGTAFLAAARLRSRGTLRKPERRYYYRAYDLDGPGWRRIRQRAEPYRDALADLFDPDELVRLLPAPERDAALEHPIRDGFARKLILGLMLWAAEHPVR